MRSTFAGLNTMVRGINSNRLSLDTVGHNITNASTTGYSRQSVNLSATASQEIYSIYGSQQVGTGVDSLSILRARNVYADKQYWKENGTNSYYTTRQTNYDKVEAIYNDSDNNGIQNAMEDFYKSWSELSTSASTSSNRTSVVENGQVFTDRLQTAATQMQSQIKANYDELSTEVDKVNNITDQIVALNKNIASIEATGSNANDLRDSRDNLVDSLSTYMNVNVYTEANGMYTIVSNGATMVGGISKLNLKLSTGTANDTYGVTDYDIQLAETGTSFDAGSGSLKAEQDAIAEDKGYIDKMANMAAFMMTTFNAQHKAGVGIDSDATTGTNFYGESGKAYIWDDTNQCVNVASQTVSKTTTSGTTTVAVTTGAVSDTLKGVQIIKAMTVNSALTATDGENLVAARGITYTTTDPSMYTTANSTNTYTMSSMNGTADGSNATLMSTLFNCTKENTGITTGDRSIGDVSLESYYNNAMSALGVDSEATTSKVTAQADILTQVSNWRSSTSGVNWNEELTNMLEFQKGFSACSRCLTTMDEMLDKLINSTGTVGR